MHYTLDEHRHRFAAWCATRAASSSRLCRFKTADGARLISGTELEVMARSWDAMPEPEYFNSVHRSLRCQMVRLAPEVIGDGPSKQFTHGVAAQLINVYLKAACVGPMPANREAPGGMRDDKLNAVHPPIGRGLLTALERHNVGGLRPIWASLNRTGWSKFDSKQYEHVIQAVREVTNGALWRIEGFWVDRQSEPPVAVPGDATVRRNPDR